MTTLNRSIATFVFVLFLGLNLTFAQKNTLKTTSTEYIKASKQEVMDALRHYEEFPNWSPFLVSDPEQKYVIEGENGAVGSSFAWEGVGEKSQGVQRIATIEGNDYISMDCDVTKPFKTKSVFEYQLEEKEDGVLVTQSFRSTMSSRFGYFMAKLFGAEKEIAKINELGLDRLKAYVENGTVETATAEAK